MLEFIVSAILWSTVDPNTGAELRASCNHVEFDYGAEARATPVILKFYKKSPSGSYIWTYKVPMDFTPTGSVVLEPAIYWVEEVKTQDEMVFLMGDKVYKFDLTGSAEKLKECNGDVVERYTPQT